MGWVHVDPRTLLKLQTENDNGGLTATSRVKFIIDKVHINGYDFFQYDGTEYINDLFVYANLPSPPETTSIDYDSIREKVAFRLDRNVSSLCEFHIFPNLLEST